MNEDERNALELIEESCGPLDEILTLYKDGLRPDHAQTLTECRDKLEQILVDLEPEGTR